MLEQIEASRYWRESGSFELTLLNTETKKLCIRSEIVTADGHYLACSCGWFVRRQFSRAAGGRLIQHTLPQLARSLVNVHPCLHGGCRAAGWRPVA